MLSPGPQSIVRGLTNPPFIAFVATTQLCRSAIRPNTPCGVRDVACHVQLAFVLSLLGPPWCQWCSGWCARGCSAAVAFGWVCLSHVSGWFRLLRCSLWLHLKCLAFCRVRGYRVARGNVGAQAGCSRHSAAQWPPHHPRTARVLDVESKWHGCKCSRHEIDIFGCFQSERRSCEPPLRAWVAFVASAAAGRGRDHPIGPEPLHTYRRQSRHPRQACEGGVAKLPKERRWDVGSMGPHVWWCARHQHQGPAGLKTEVGSLTEWDAVWASIVLERDLCEGASHSAPKGTDAWRETSAAAK